MLSSPDKWFYFNYDTDSTNYKYGRYLDRLQGSYGVETNGTSTTVTAVTAGTSPFASVGAGDIIWFNQGETEYRTKVASVTNLDTIVVADALDLSATPAWHFQPFRIGTTASAGWHKIDQLVDRTLFIQLISVADSVTIIVEGRGQGDLGSTPFTIVPATAYAAAAEVPIAIADSVLFLRVGVKSTTTASGADDINIWLEGTLRW